eukprot:Opistho-1_new@17606
MPGDATRRGLLPLLPGRTPGWCCVACGGPACRAGPLAAAGSVRRTAGACSLCCTDTSCRCSAGAVGASALRPASARGDDCASCCALAAACRARASASTRALLPCRRKISVSRSSTSTSSVAGGGAVALSGGFSSTKRPALSFRRAGCAEAAPREWALAGAACAFAAFLRAVVRGESGAPFLCCTDAPRAVPRAASADAFLLLSISDASLSPSPECADDHVLSSDSRCESPRSTDRRRATDGTRPLASTGGVAATGARDASEWTSTRGCECAPTDGLRCAAAADATDTVTDSSAVCTGADRVAPFNAEAPKATDGRSVLESPERRSSAAG